MPLFSSILVVVEDTVKIDEGCLRSVLWQFCHLAERYFAGILFVEAHNP